MSVSLSPWVETNISSYSTELSLVQRYTHQASASIVFLGGKWKHNLELN